MKRRKILAWLLAMTMVLTMFPLSVFAKSLTFSNLNISSCPILSGHTKITSVKAISLQEDAEVVVTGSTVKNFDSSSYKEHTNLTVDNNSSSNITISGTCEDVKDNYLVLIAQDSQGAYYIYCQKNSIDYNDANGTWSAKGAKYDDTFGFQNGGQWYAAKMLVKVEASGSGTVSLSNSGYSTSDSAYYEHNTEAKLYAKPNTGYVFKKWNDGDTNATRTVTVTSDKTYTAVFEKVEATDGDENTYPTVAKALESVDSGTITTNDDVTLTAVTDGKLKEDVTLKTKAGEFTAKDGNATIDVTSAGAVTVKSGKVEAEEGSVTATLGSTDNTFKSNDSFTVNLTDDTLILTVPEETTVTDENDIEYIGGGTAGTDDTDGTFTFDNDGNVTISAGASIANDDAKITGVEKEGSGNDTKVKFDENYALILVAGKGKATGGQSLKVKVNGDKTVTVSIPNTKTYTIDADNTPPLVCELKEDESVTLDGITYTAGANDREFPIGVDKLVNTGDKATVPEETEAAIALGDNEDAPTINVPSTNESATVITKGGNTGDAEEETIPTTVEIGANDKFTLNEKDYIAGDEGATFGVNETESTAFLKDGNAVVKNGTNLDVQTGDTVVPVTATGKQIVVKVEEDGKSSATVPNGGSVTITFDDNYKKYPSKEDGTKFVFDKDGNVTLADGTTELKNNKSIIGGASEKEITNTGDNDEITITVKGNDPEGCDTVTIPENGKVKIGDDEYVAVDGEVTIVVGSDKNKLTEGSVMFDMPASISVGDNNTLVTNTGDSQIKVTTDGKITIPEGGQADIGKADIGKAEITDVEQETTFTINEVDVYKVEVSLNKGETITINEVIYTGIESDGVSGGTLTIDPVSGKVTGISGNIYTEIKEDSLTEDFSYDIVPGQSVTVGKYVYTAPGIEGSELGDVTIKGRGKDATTNKVLSPAVVLKNDNGTADVSLRYKPETKTTYTAAATSTAFAIAANDTSTKNIELLDNSADANSALKFTDKEVYNVNGVTYQAKIVEDEHTIAYTVTYGTKTETITTSDGTTERTSNANLVSVETGSKITATMKAAAAIKIGSGMVGDKKFTSPLPFTATNSGASIMIDNTGESGDGPVISKNDSSYLIPVYGRKENGAYDKDNIIGYRVTKMDSEGGSTYSLEKREYAEREFENIGENIGQTIGSMTKPTKDGYVFTGWYSDRELTKRYDDNEIVTEETALYAGWKVDPVRQLILTIGSVNATVFGQAKLNDVAPKIVNSRTMLPARFVAENLGATVEWDSEKQLVTITGKNEKNEDVTILITIGAEYAVVNGENVKLDSPAFVENGRTYTPVRFISEELGTSVEWDENTQQVIITKALAEEE